jgi:hypothetical protein
VQVRHWIAGGVVVLGLAGAYFLGVHVSPPPVAEVVTPHERPANGAGSSGAASTPTAAPTAPTPTPSQAAAPGNDSGFGFASVEQIARERSQQNYQAASPNCRPRSRT